MRRLATLASLLILSAAPAVAVPKPHVVGFGRWQLANWLVGPDEDKSQELRIRPLFVDGKIKEFTTGLQHEITERLFVVRRVFHLNDSLPNEKASSPRWLWQRGGWVLVDRVTGRIAPLTLADFDTYSSVGEWYRDYIAYCGVSEDGTKLFAIVVQVGRRKPWLRKPLGPPEAMDTPDSACATPIWERRPARVTFSPKNGQQMIFSIRRRTIDLVNDGSDEDEASE